MSPVPRAAPPRSAVVILTGGLLATTLSGCSLFGVGESEAAHAAATEYVNLIATADAADLETLWQTTSTEEPAVLRTAGQVLAGATERIEVLDVAEAESVEGRVDVPYESDLDGAEARQVTFTYQLAGTEREGTVLLAPHENRPLDDADTWTVLVPLLGTVTVPPVPLGAIVMDTQVGGVDAEVGDDYSATELQLYPAVYDVQQTADPYLSSATDQLTVLAGQSLELPALEVAGTEETAAELTDDLLATIEGCADRSVPCSSPVADWIQSQGIDNLWMTGWSLEVTAAPEVTLTGNQAAFSGGTILMTFSNGTEQEIDLEGNTAWIVDNQSWTPRVLRHEITLTGAAR